MIDSDLTEEEVMLFALLMDESGVDHMEFLWADGSSENGLFRTWPIQMAWWRTPGKKVLSAGSRSIGKSLSILGRCFAFPFIMSDDEMVITAPDGDRLGAITDKVETLFLNNSIAESMLAPGARGRIKHRPFHISFDNGSRIMGRIPRLDGTGIQGTHPIWLEHDEACFSGDTLIYTIDGYKRIDKINIGEYVLTHKNRWKKVTNVWNKGIRDTVIVKGQGHHGLRVTPNHKFWAKKVTKWKDTKNKWGVKELTDFKWIEAQDLNDSFWSSVINIPEVELPNKIPKAQTGTSYAIDVLSNDFLWCLGLYIAEGSTSSSYGNGGKLNKLTWSIHKDEVPYVIFRLEAAGIKYFVQPVQNTKNCMNVVVASVNLASWINKECGHGAHNKKIPSWVFSLDEGQRKMVFDGLIYGDGNINKDPRYADGACNYTTVSKSLAYDVKTLAQTLGLSTTIIYREGGEITIRDKQYNSGPSYSVRIGGNSGQGFYDEHLKLNKVKSISKAQPIEVWDIEVEDDHSFVAESIVVHNSTYPERGWKEIVETVKIQQDAAKWRCVAEDQKVFTRDGWKKIQDINIGDLVLTHKNNWKPVLNVWDNGIQECVKVKGNGSPGIIVTENHKFYTREQFRYDDNKNLTDPEWTSVSSFVTTNGSRTHWSSPIYISNNKSTVPLMQKLPKERLMIDDTSSLDWLWLYGLFLAEGYTCDFNYHGHNHRRSHWCVNDSECDYVAEKLKAFGLNPQLYKQGEHSVKVIINSGPIQRWLKENAGSLAHNKFIANWVWDLSEESRQAIFDGMNYGDGSWSKDRRRWEYVTVSSDLAFGIKMLAQSLGYVANVRHYDAHESIIEGRTVASKESWSVQMTHIDDFINPHSVIMDNLIWSPVQGPIEPYGKRHVYDLEVEDDHSYIVEGIVVSNCHGVTMGPGNTFDDKVNGGDQTWVVKKLPAMYRPNWTEKERQDKIIEYGGYESLDYKRNILGTAEGADSSLLVLARLMADVDTDELSEYNMSEYYNVSVTDALVAEADDILDLVDPPISHTEFKKVWIGMDYGLTTSKSCILVFTEIQLPGEKSGRLKLVARVMMSRIPTEQQVRVIKHLMSIYRPIAIAFDAHGVGQPAYEWLQKEVREDPSISWMLDRIKGYSFSENIVVDFDEKIDINTDIKEDWKRAIITRKTSDASLDILRLVVDTGRIWLPYDKELIGELQSIPRKELMTLDEYGKPKRKKGQHMLDALRFALLAWKQQPIEEVVNKYENSWEPPSMIIMDYL